MDEQCLNSLPCTHCVVLTTLSLLETTSWSRLTLYQVANENRLTLLDLYKLFATKGALLAGILDYIHQETRIRFDATGIELGTQEALLEIILCRLESLETFKCAFQNLERDFYKTPFSTVEALPAVCSGLKEMLQQAGYTIDGFLGMINLKGFAIVYVLILYHWMRDDSNDPAKIMAMVDGLLKKTSRLWKGFRSKGAENVYK